MRHWKSPFVPRCRQVVGKRRHYSGSWSRLSKALRQNHPLCQVCGVLPSEQVHHVVPVQVDRRLMLDPRNLVVCCRACHEKLDHPRDRPRPA